MERRPPVRRALGSGDRPMAGIERVCYRFGFIERLGEVARLPAITIAEPSDLPKDVLALLDAGVRLKASAPHIPVRFSRPTGSHDPAMTAGRFVIGRATRRWPARPARPGRNDDETDGGASHGSLLRGHDGHGCSRLQPVRELPAPDGPGHDDAHVRWRHDDDSLARPGRHDAPGVPVRARVRIDHEPAPADRLHPSLALHRRYAPGARDEPPLLPEHGGPER